MLCYCSPCNGIARNRDLSCFRGIFLTVIAAWRVGPSTEVSLPSFMSAVAGPNGGVTAIAVVFFLSSAYLSSSRDQARIPGCHFPLAGRAIAAQP